MNVCFKNIRKYCKAPEYCKAMKIFLEVKKFKKLFCGLFCENFDIGSPLFNRFTFRVMFRRGSHRSLAADKNFNIAQHYYNHYKLYLMHQ